MLIRYDNPRNLAEDVARRRGKFLACGVEIAEMGLASQDAVGKLIEELADIRDRQLPQRGDLPKFATDVETGRYVNEGYTCIADHVRGGILDLVPLEGAQFIHRDWGEVKTCRTRDLTKNVWKSSWWALGRLQIDLRHHIGRVSGSTTLDGRDSVTLHDIIKCDEGGWVKIDDLVRMDVLRASNTRRITQSAASYRDRDQRLKIYKERLQLIINGNILSAKKPDGKVRLQLLGIRVKEPPVGPYTLGAAGSNMMVSRADRIAEIQRDPHLRRNQQYLGQSDGWVRPWAVRALSGHTVHYEPEKNLMELDPHKFAISPSLSLVNQIGGAYHATSCRNLLPIVERGILPGTSIQDAQYTRYDTGRLHSYFGVFPPWDPRNITTKQRVSGRGNSAMPLVVLHVPALDLVRLQGRITDSGNIIVNRPVPFSLESMVRDPIRNLKTPTTFLISKSFLERRMTTLMIPVRLFCFRESHQFWSQGLRSPGPPCNLPSTSTPALATALMPTA